MRADKWGGAARVACGVGSNEALAFIFIAGPDLTLSARERTGLNWHVMSVVQSKNGAPFFWRLTGAVSPAVRIKLAYTARW